MIGKPPRDGSCPSCDRPVVSPAPMIVVSPDVLSELVREAVRDAIAETPAPRRMRAKASTPAEPPFVDELAQKRAHAALRRLGLLPPVKKGRRA